MTPASMLSNQAIEHINDVKPFSDQDKILFDELYSVLKKHGAENRFGINLLHRHFDLAPDEFLLEVTDSANRKQLITPAKSTMVIQDYIVTSWSLTEDGPVAQLRCQVEQTSIPPQHVDRRF